MRWRRRQVAASYVATSPDGRIYEVAADGSSKTFFDPDDKYIWSLAVAPDGAVYAGTGEKGTIYRITPDGKGAVFYKTNTTNVVSLAIDKDGNVIAGTESPGRIFRIDRQGKGVRAARLPVQGNTHGEDCG